MVEDFVGIQCQIKELFSQVLDIDKKDGSVPEKMTAYVKTESAFQFCPQRSEERRVGKECRL